MWRVWLILGLLSAACGGTPPLTPRQSAVHESRRLSLSMKGSEALSPYKDVEYQLKWRDDRLHFVHRRHYFATFGEQAGTVVLSDSRAQELASEFASCGTDAATLDAEEPKTSGWRYTLEWSWDDEPSTQVTVKDPVAHHDMAWWCVDQMMVGLVTEEFVELPGFEDWVYVAESQRGYLNLTTMPTAEVIIDGMRTGWWTPVEQLPIAAGVHSVRFLAPGEPPIDKTYELVVDVGSTTVLRTELR